LAQSNEVSSPHGKIALYSWKELTRASRVMAPFQLQSTHFVAKVTCNMQHKGFSVIKEKITANNQDQIRLGKELDLVAQID